MNRHDPLEGVAFRRRVPGAPKISSGGIVIINVSCWSMNTENMRWPSGA